MLHDHFIGICHTGWMRQRKCAVRRQSVHWKVAGCIGGIKGEAVDINEVLEGEQFIIDLHDDGTATVSEGTADESEATWTETDKGVKVEGDDINMEFADNDGKLSCKILGVKKIGRAHV